MANFFLSSGELLTLLMWAIAVAIVASPLLLAAWYLRRLLVAVAHCARALDHLCSIAQPPATVTRLRSRRSAD